MSNNALERPPRPLTLPPPPETWKQFHYPVSFVMFLFLNTHEVSSLEMNFQLLSFRSPINSLLPVSFPWVALFWKSQTPEPLQSSQAALLIPLNQVSIPHIPALLNSASNAAVQL